ncbi:MAG: hypothetical protein ACXWDN_10050 [Limisphaerales bacterium]
MQLGGLFGVYVMVNTCKWVVSSILIAGVGVVLFLFHDAILAWVGSAALALVAVAAMFWTPFGERDDEDEDNEDEDEDEDDE